MADEITRSRRGLKICCGVTGILFVIFLIVSVILSVTVFKPKQPKIIAQPTSLEKVEFSIFPPSLNVTLGVTITIENRNYGSFKYKHSTAFVNYHGETVAEISIEDDTVPAKGKINITTSADIMGDKLISSPYFWEDFQTGCLNFTSTTTLHGKVSVFKILKLKGKAYSICDISVYVRSCAVQSTCKSKFKL